MKSLFGVDMDLDGNVDAFDDFLFMHMIDEEEKRQNEKSDRFDQDANADDDSDTW